MRPGRPKAHQSEFWDTFLIKLFIRNGYPQHPCHNPKMRPGRLNAYQYAIWDTFLIKLLRRNDYPQHPRQDTKMKAGRPKAHQHEFWHRSADAQCRCKRVQCRCEGVQFRQGFVPKLDQSLKLATATSAPPWQQSADAMLRFVQGFITKIEVPSAVPTSFGTAVPMQTCAVPMRRCAIYTRTCTKN